LTGFGYVTANGGVVWRDGDSGPEVLLVHRPKYGDWTFPKGKNELREDDETCAVREVEEETGLRCSVGRELPSTKYHDSLGRAKLVRYWVMTVDEAQPRAPDDEVDASEWLSVEAARARLTYERDIPVLDAFAEG
jgi:8-oxo-dGTP pyrophosphatase MutT (NUDIX family)